MPAFTVAALDSLLEPGGDKNLHKSQPLRQKSHKQSDKEIRYCYVSPTIYTTPKPTPLPGSPTSFFPSPYVINHKRRGPRLQRSLQGNVDQTPEGNKTELGNSVKSDVDAKLGSCISNSDPAIALSVACQDLPDEILSEQNRCNPQAANNTRQVLCGCLDGNYDEDSFSGIQDSTSMFGNNEADDNDDTEQSMKSSSTLVDYFDAYEELSSEGNSQCGLEAELVETSSKLLMETEKRKQAEEYLTKVQKTLQEISEQLSEVGFVLPSFPDQMLACSGSKQSKSNGVADEWKQQLVVARLVAGAVGKGAGRAEVELEMEDQTAAKNLEISLLSDRLHYYEAVNHEMSQRNQKAVEKGRKDRLRRQKWQRRWVWGSIGLVIALGSATLIWSYFPSSSDQTCNCPVSKDTIGDV